MAGDDHQHGRRASAIDAPCPREGQDSCVGNSLRRTPAGSTIASVPVRTRRDSTRIRPWTPCSSTPTSGRPRPSSSSAAAPERSPAGSSRLSYRAMPATSVWISARRWSAWRRDGWSPGGTGRRCGSRTALPGSPCRTAISTGSWRPTSSTCSAPTTRPRCSPRPIASCGLMDCCVRSA